MKNLEIARILKNIADILELQEVQWKPQAYRKAAQGIESLTEDILDVYKRGELEKIPGVGEHIALKIEEFLKKGKLNYYENLKKKVKVDLENLQKIPDLGPRKIKILYQELNVKNVPELEKAIRNGELKGLKGFGEKTENNLLRGIKFLRTLPKRIYYFNAQTIVDDLTKYLQKFKHVKKIEIAGSFRRGKETVGDLDFLVVSDKPEEVMKFFVSYPDVKDVIIKGRTKSSVMLENGLQVDLRVVKEKEFGSALLYFIGNKEHNISLRKLALKKGYTLNEYGLLNLKSKKWLAGRTEIDIYKKLGLEFISPELRENNGEIEVSRNNKLPKLVELKDLKGIFHNHSTWSDGNNSLLEMAKEAERLNLKFISFNDHYGNIGIANPLDEKKLVKYLQEIEKVRKKVGIRVFSGVEIDILKNGTLPLSAKKLKELDVVIASTHMALKMHEKEMTKRIILALENNPVNIWGHPTARHLNERPEIKINLEKAFSVCKERDVYLEINGAPKRMDLNGENVKSALEIGCKFALSTDAHDASHLKHYHLALLMARRGWTEKKNILNCLALPKIEKALKK